MKWEAALYAQAAECYVSKPVSRWLERLCIVVNGSKSHGDEFALHQQFLPFVWFTDDISLRLGDKLLVLTLDE